MFFCNKEQVCARYVKVGYYYQDCTVKDFKCVLYYGLYEVFSFICRIFYLLSYDN